MADTQHEEEIRRRQRQVPNELEQLSNVIDHLTTVVDNFESELLAVLTQPSLPLQNIKEEIIDTSVPLANDINLFRCRIESITSRMEDLSSRLEL